MEKAGVLVVDDEKGVQRSFEMVLGDFYNISLAGTGKEAISILKKEDIDLVLLDIMLPDENGLNLLARIKDLDPHIEVIMVTAVKDIQVAVKAIKAGAYEYIIKPFDVEEVMTIIARAIDNRSVVRELIYLREELGRRHLFEKMIGQTEEMKSVFDLIERVAGSDGTVLIQGESGTGKELVAKAVHNRSARHGHPFVVVNCGAIPPNLVESELFGHVKGAFTGAIKPRMGKLEMAKNGTVFFDDIDALDINIQAKLLRVIQEKEFERVGGDKLVKIDVRFIAACNKNLDELVSGGKFREDLYYRLNVLPLYLPPLRERKADIPILVEHFLKIHAKRYGKPEKKISKAALNLLVSYDWPGNVRELENVMERIATITEQETIMPQDLLLRPSLSPVSQDLPLKEAVSRFERRYIEDVLVSCGYSRKKAAEKLNIHRNTLLSKINEYGIDVP